MALVKLERVVYGDEPLNEAEEFGTLANIVEQSQKILYILSHSWNRRKAKLAQIALSAIQEEYKTPDQDRKRVGVGRAIDTQGIPNEELLARQLGKRIGQYKRRTEELNRLNGGH
jgi:hypothetical protein